MLTSISAAAATATNVMISIAGFLAFRSVYDAPKEYPSSDSTSAHRSSQWPTPMASMMTAAIIERCISRGPFSS